MASTEKARQVMRGLVDVFSAETFPGLCAKAYIQAPDIPSAKWSLVNRLAMLLQGTADARGYRQWASVGRHPKKGSHAIYILGPRLVNKKPKDGEQTDGGTGQGRVLVGFCGIPVFRYEDTEGAALAKYVPKTIPPLFGLAAKNGINVKYQNSVEGEYGSINYRTSQMTLSTEDPVTYFHELVHWYDHKLNLGNPNEKQGQDPTRETVAQLGACVLAAMHGMDAKTYTWNYIAGYNKADTPEQIGRACAKVIDRVQKIIDAILADAEKSDKSEGKKASAATAVVPK